jgi:hypothetical protein
MPRTAGMDQSTPRALLAEAREPLATVAARNRHSELTMKTIQATRLDRSAARAVAPRSARAPRVAAAGGGFGFGAAADKPAAAKKPAKKNFKLERLLAEEPTLYTPGATAAVSEGAADDAWFAVPGVDAKTTFVSKPVKAVILPTGRAICLYKPPGGDAIFCSDAESTAYR